MPEITLCKGCHRVVWDTDTNEGYCCFCSDYEEPEGQEPEKAQLPEKPEKTK